MVAGTVYAVGVLVVTGTTAPTFAGSNALTGTEAAQVPQLSAAVSGQTDFPSTPFTIAVGSVSASGQRIYGVLTP